MDKRENVATYPAPYTPSLLPSVVERSFCREDDEEDDLWEESLPDEQQKGEDYGDRADNVSCDDDGWRERSSMPSFTIYFDFETSCRVSVLGCSRRSEDTTESTDESSVDAASEASEESHNLDFIFSDSESNASSVDSEFPETDDQSEYEVKSIMTDMSGVVKSFASQVSKRSKKRSRMVKSIMKKMFALDSSLSRLSINSAGRKGCDKVSRN